MNAMKNSRKLLFPKVEKEVAETVLLGPIIISTKRGVLARRIILNWT